ncbi:hypothetical protein UY3_08404 [Chelonia mydas]|uniref:Uncharacterized protein n=1 Tax=Chelonia mydas TaxID=8469 RepID=M7BB84_CHEMY|nr:hypothetical protein UY3_08404 [Chelonia mydas]
MGDKQKFTEADDLSMTFTKNNCDKMGSGGSSTHRCCSSQRLRDPPATHGGWELCRGSELQCRQLGAAGVMHGDLELQGLPATHGSLELQEPPIACGNLEFQGPPHPPSCSWEIQTQWLRCAVSPSMTQSFGAGSWELPGMSTPAAAESSGSPAG